MDLQHPLDADIRKRVRTSVSNQAEFAQAIGRSQGWLNKYMHGAGNATIDDVVRMLALLIGVETQPLTAMEQRLLKVCRRIPPDVRDEVLPDVLDYAEHRARTARRAQSKESSEPAAHSPRTTARTARGTR